MRYKCEGILQAQQCAKCAVSTIILVAIKESLFFYSLRITKRNNNKIFMYHGATASVFVKGKKACFDICIVNEILSVSQSRCKKSRGKKKKKEVRSQSSQVVSCQEPTGRFLVPS